jgi:hypothetical protein
LDFGVVAVGDAEKRIHDMYFPPPRVVVLGRALPMNRKKCNSLRIA